jgi:hypothetical protein
MPHEQYVWSNTVVLHVQQDLERNRHRSRGRILKQSTHNTLTRHSHQGISLGLEAVSQCVIASDVAVCCWVGKIAEVNLCICTGLLSSRIALVADDLALLVFNVCNSQQCILGMCITLLQSVTVMSGQMTGHLPTYYHT